MAGSSTPTVHFVLVRLLLRYPTRDLCRFAPPVVAPLPAIPQHLLRMNCGYGASMSPACGVLTSSLACPGLRTFCAAAVPLSLLPPFSVPFTPFRYSARARYSLNYEDLKERIRRAWK